jgi:hypothetical protein
VARDLCRWGVLREDEQEILLFFRRRVYPTVDPRPERTLVTRVRKALDGEGTVDARTGSLISLADVTGSLAARSLANELAQLASAPEIAQ